LIESNKVASTIGPKLALDDLWCMHIVPAWAAFTGAEGFYAQSTAPLLFDTALSLCATIQQNR